MWHNVNTARFLQRLPCKVGLHSFRREVKGLSATPSGRKVIFFVSTCWLCPVHRSWMIALAGKDNFESETTEDQPRRWS